MRKYKNLLLVFTLFLFSCSNYLNIVDANKTKHISGIKNRKNYIDYKIKIESKVDFNFESIKLNNTKITETLFVKNLSTGLSSTKVNSDVKKGSYQFGFRIYDTASFNLEETITFNYLIQNKEFQLKKIIKKVDNIKTNK